MNASFNCCNRLTLAMTLLFSLFTANALALDNWQMTITVDNQYDIYFGDSLLSAPTFVGGDNNWMNTEVYTPSGINPSDFLYVATASDFSSLQGFIGEFKNLTLGNTILTNDNSGTPWEVFPAGAHLAALNAIDASIPAGAWPFSTQPTTSQVQTAVNYATTNNLWTQPTSRAGWDNSGGPPPWGVRPLVPAAAEWIWYESGNSVSPVTPFGGFNHDEFLVFRIAGQAVPEPTSLALVLWGVLGIAGIVPRRRHDRGAKC